MVKETDKNYKELNYHFHRLRYMMAVMVMLGCILFTPALIWLFEQSVTIWDIPLILYYIFGVWLCMIICALLINREFIKKNYTDINIKQSYDEK